MIKILLLLIIFVLTLPVALADSVFSNPAFDSVLVLIFAGVIFFSIRELIKRMK